MDAVVIASGGMDSMTLAYKLVKEGSDPKDLLLLGFNYGQKHSKELNEMQSVAALLGAKSDVVDLTAISGLLAASALTDAGRDVPEGHYAEDNMRATIVPNRNAIMLSIAAGAAVTFDADMVATGVHAGDHFVYPDCRPTFIESMRETISLATEGAVGLYAPFLYMTKAEIAAEGAQAGVPFELTWSCYKGGEIHCGKCGTCVERIEAFRLAGVEDRTVYAETEFADKVLAANR